MQLSSLKRVLVIAEIGSVHDGSFGNALKLIEAAAECGAGAVKFQTHIAEAETTRDAPSPGYFSAEDRFSYFARTGFSQDQWKQIKAHCDASGVIFMSSPFSVQAVDLLESLDMQLYKVPSGEVTNTPLLKRMAETGKPVLLSSGMSNWAELDRAVEVLKDCKAEFAVLQCSSMYPCRDEAVGLNVLAEMRDRYSVPVGFSDHTTESYAAIAAVTLGAAIVEKHFTFSKRMYGSDAQHSMEPPQFRQLVSSIRGVEAILAAPVDKDRNDQYLEMKQIFEKSLVAARDLCAGQVLVENDIAVKKPGTGIPADQLGSIIGRKLVRPVSADQLFKDVDFE